MGNGSNVAWVKHRPILLVQYHPWISKPAILNSGYHEYITYYFICKYGAVRTNCSEFKLEMRGAMFSAMSSG